MRLWSRLVTVLEAAERLLRDPETIRRWIRSGKLPAEKVGLQHMIDDADLPGEATVPLPEAWRRTIRVSRARRGHRGPACTDRPLTLVVDASAATALCLAEDGFDLLEGELLAPILLRSDHLPESLLAAG